MLIITNEETVVDTSPPQDKQKLWIEATVVSFERVTEAIDSAAKTNLTNYNISSIMSDNAIVFDQLALTCYQINETTVDVKYYNASTDEWTVVEEGTVNLTYFVENDVLVIVNNSAVVTDDILEMNFATVENDTLIL